ncbi:MAG: GspMb/PilO family protein [Gemmatimonadaceae bacterium]
MPGAERPLTGNDRPRQTIIVGAWIVFAALSIVFGVIPQAKRWGAREQQIRIAETKLRELSGVVNGQSQLDSLVRAQEQALTLQPRRVLRSRSRALAASALQSLVQELAEVSNVTVTRLDVANLESSGDLPITLAANGDIYGLANLLQQIRSARYAVVVDKLITQNNSALRGAPDVLQITLSLHAPVIVQ